MNPDESVSVIGDAALAALSVAGRRDLAARLAVLEEPAGAAGVEAARRRRRFVEVVGAGALVLVPWIAVLASTLPHRYIASHWTLTWVGFDAALLAGLASTAWLAWRGRRVVAVAALVTATLLLCDAWFDVLTADPADVVVSVLSAVVLEVPLAVLLLLAVRLVLRRGNEITASGTLPGPRRAPRWTDQVR